MFILFYAFILCLFSRFEWGTNRPLYAFEEGHGRLNAPLDPPVAVAAVVVFPVRGGPLCVPPSAHRRPHRTRVVHCPGVSGVSP